MLNKVLDMLRRYQMVQPGDTVTAAVSGGADSTALLYALYLLKDKLRIRLEAVHYNHQLRGGEAERDQAFVESLCHRLDIPCHIGQGAVRAGKKGLEAAARDARYAYFARFSGKIATAHTADDNTETVLMHLVRGTGLKGLGGIAPVRGNIIRPMLTVTRDEVTEFLRENFLRYVEDSTNAEDDFLRNRLRHHVMPLLKAENPRLAVNFSAMAMKLRDDEALLEELAAAELEPDVARLRQMHPALRSRAIIAFLRRGGVPEPEAEHLALVEKLVFSEKPSAQADLPGGITVARNYGKLTVLGEQTALETVVLPEQGVLELPELGLRVICEPAELPENTSGCFTVVPVGQAVLRCRCAGDEIRLPGGKKSLKKLFIDRKIPAAQRMRIPVIADDMGILGIYGFGADLDRFGPGLRIRFEETQKNWEEQT